MYPPPDAAPFQPLPSRRWHPLLAVPAVIAATLVMPPLGAALAFMVGWAKTGKAVTVVLASIWFVVLVVAGSSPKNTQDDAKPRPQPATTVTVTAAAPAPPASVPASSATPAPPSSTPGTAATPTPPPPPPVRAPAQPQQEVPEQPPSRPQPSAADDSKARPPAGPPASGGTSSGGSSSTGGGGGSVSYRNCTAVRQAGAAPIHRGEPGYGSHLDRDGDGVACE